MKKIIFRKFLFDCLAFFIISLISTSVIIWVFQAVNYLDIIIDEGRGYNIYLAYSFLSFPKILSKILPFAFFFSFSYVVAKYELNNQLLIFWNFGISKIKLIHFFFIFSIFLFFFQIIFTTLLVPKSQELARSIIRTSNYNFVDNFIKIKKFNADVNDLTIYTESKDQDGNYNNIYIKKNSGKNDFQITIAKKGVFRNKNDLPILELYDGENSNLINGKITKFSFTKSEFNLSSYSNNTILVKKTQEHKTIEIVKCIKTLTNGNIDKIKQIKKEIRNCDLQNLDNIIAELYKRFVIPLYIPVLMLITMLLITHSKEKVNYSKHRFFIFLFGFLIIIFSESTLRFINTSFYNNFLISLIPVIITFFLYFYFLIKLNSRKSIK
jgi:lipopolysaccharide export system permease protein